MTVAALMYSSPAMSALVFRGARYRRGQPAGRDIGAGNRGARHRGGQPAGAATVPADPPVPACDSPILPSREACRPLTRRRRMGPRSAGEVPPPGASGESLSGPLRGPLHVADRCRDRRLAAQRVAQRNHHVLGVQPLTVVGALRDGIAEALLPQGENRGTCPEQGRRSVCGHFTSGLPYRFRSRAVRSWFPPAIGLPRCQAQRPVPLSRCASHRWRS